MRKKRNRALYIALKRTHVFETLSIFIFTFFAISYAIFLLDPAFSSYGTSIWYCFELITTIGFGETVATSTIGKLLSVFLSIYSIGIIAIVTSTMVTYHQVKVRTQKDDSLFFFMDQLEHLPELTPDELEELSKKIKQLRS